MTKDMNAAMMEASTKPVDPLTHTRAAVPIEARSDAEDAAVSEILSHWLEETGNPTPGSSMDFGWEGYDALDPPIEVQKAYVPATWLDALGRDHSEPSTDRSGQISSVNSDDNGLYRMFRNVSP